MTWLRRLVGFVVSCFRLAWFGPGKPLCPACLREIVVPEEWVAAARGLPVAFLDCRCGRAIAIDMRGELDGEVRENLTIPEAVRAAAAAEKGGSADE